MREGLRRIRNGILLGLAWAAVWAPLAVLIGVMIIDPDNSMDEMWVAVGAYPGFLCGFLFQTIRGIAGRGRPLGELALARVAAWGAAAGVLVGAFPFTIGSSSSAIPLWQLAGMVIGAIAVMSVLSALASALTARTITKQRLGSAHGGALSRGPV